MSLPDGPKSLELWQQLRWLATPFSFMRDSRERYGESFTVAIGKGNSGYRLPSRTADFAAADAKTASSNESESGKALTIKSDRIRGNRNYVFRNCQ